MNRVSPWVVVVLGTWFVAVLSGCTKDVTGPNRAPVADAGPDVEVGPDDPVVLDGSGSRDPDGDLLSYRWTLIHAPADGQAGLSEEEQVMAALTPDAPGVWTVRLVVRDGRLDSEPDVVQVRVTGCSSDLDCDDGVACTEDTCVGGRCANTGSDAECDDGQWCTGQETCDPALGCQAGTSPCDDGVACTLDTCDEAGQTCDHTPDATACDDGQYCNGVEVCDPVSGCGPGASVSCDDGVGCTLDTCDEGADRCTSIAQDSECDDGLACNGAETCDPVLDCQAGVALDCDDGFACTIDSCDEALGCVNQPDDGICDDGQWCNGAETCDPDAGCQAGNAPACDDGVACTLDSCDEVGDTCAHTPDDLACNDGNPCTLDSCDAQAGCQSLPGNDGAACSIGPCDGICTDGLCPPCSCSDDAECDDGLACTSDSCTNNVCSYTADNSACDDGDWCNGAEICTVGVGCQAGAPPDCDDSVGCTDDTCDEANDQCTHQAADANCDDGDWCNGAESCDPVLDCQTGSAPNCDDGVGCTVDTCDEDADACDNSPDDGACDNGAFCDGAETCDPVAGCQSATNPCVDGIACTIDGCDEGNDSCTATPDDGLCDDGLVCNGAETCDVDQGCLPGVDAADGLACDEEDDGAGNGDWCDSTCQGGVCTAGQAPTCDDGLFCNGVETCLPASGCAAGAAEADGTGCDEGAGGNGDPCDSSCQGGSCEPVAASPGEPCDDGIGCTDPDTCDGAGGCAGVEDDTWCEDQGIGGLCRPACFGGPTGCGEPPDHLDLACSPDPVDMSQAMDTACVLDLGLTGQDACLACQAEVGFTQVDWTGFDGCDPNGWALQTGTLCYDTYANCAPGNQNQACCGDLASICQTNNGNSYLATNQATNCGGGVEEWHLEKVFDFSDLSDLRVCFGRASNNANDNQVIALWAEDLDAPGAQQIACWSGEPRDRMDDFFFRTCADLPAWVADRPHVKLQFVAHSEDDNRILMLDDISVTGWTAGCSETVIDLLAEDFDGCQDPLPASYGVWTVTGTLPCNTSDFTCLDDSDRLVADDTAGSLETRVDASDVDADLELCWYYGDKAGDAGKTLEVEIDTGTGWQTAWSHTGNQHPDNTCFQVCANLSDVDPAVHRNPDLGLRISLSSTRDPVVIDHLELRGVSNCAAGAALGLGARTDQGDGTYTFDVTNLTGAQLDGDIQCGWDSPPAGQEVAGNDVVAWRNQVPNWGHRRKLEFDNAAQSTDLPGFPVLVVLDAGWFDYAKVLQPGGGDLLFVDEDQFTVLPHEIEQWDPAGLSYIWVRVPRIDAATDLDHIWMYYGDPVNTFPEDPAGVWQDYEAVWHLAEAVDDEQDSGVHVDSTGNGNDGLQRGNNDFNPCLIGTCQVFDGFNDNVEIPSAGLQITGQALTIEALAYETGGVAHNFRHVLGAGSDGHTWQLWWDNGWDGWHGRLNAADGNTSIFTNDGSSDVWSYLALQYDGAEVRLYLNAAEIGADSTSGNLIAPDTPILLGDNPGLWPRTFPGGIDEVRISARVLSEDWLAAQLLSMIDAFVTFGPEEPL